MTPPPWLRKLLLVAHVTTSVGWLGAVAGFLAIAVASRTGDDAQTMRAAYVAMELMTLYGIVPLSVASLLIGVVQSLGSPWGLLRHHWVVVKLLLTVAAVAVLLQYTETMSAIADAAADATMSSADLRALGASPVLHSVGGLIVLIVTTVLAVYKPRGMTRYGWRHRGRAQRQKSSPVERAMPVRARPEWHQ